MLNIGQNCYIIARKITKIKYLFDIVNISLNYGNFFPKSGEICGVKYLKITMVRSID
jgi:hypothetical protein